MHRLERDHARRLAAGFALFVLVAACGPVERGDEPAVVRLTEGLQVEERASASEAPEPIAWSFDEDGLARARAHAEELLARAADEAGDDPEGEDEPAPEGDPIEDPAADAGPDPLTLAATGGFEAFMDIEALAVRDDLLVGRTVELPLLLVEMDTEDLDDDLFAVELEMRVSAGGRVSLIPDRGEFDREEFREFWRRSNAWLFSTEVEPSEELRTVTVELAHAPRRRAQDVRRLLISPGDAPGTDFAIRSVRVVTRREHLAEIPSGVSWQGLGEIWREALVLRAPASATVARELPSHPWLELHMGTLQPHPITFRVAVRAGQDDARVMLRRTVTTPDRWETASLDLSDFAGELVQLELSVESPEPGAIGLFGTLAVRNRGAAPTARAGVKPPRGVILILADTLRRDHLDAYGYERETAPTLTRLAGEGALFLDDVSQGTWTKVSVPAMLSSLYPATHGLVNAVDRLPESVTTLAEAFQQAGYATFATSSVFFTGRLSNLQQGLDVLHERESFPEVEHSGSKTARVYVDRLLAWIEEHRDVPFYARLHAFDPHDPFVPYAPYDALWSAPDAEQLHDKDVETVEAWLEENDKEPSEMPSREELVAAGVDPQAFVARELDWYDASIRAMDVEIARLFERLEELDLADDVLVAFISDHGEEFLDHGHHFHGDTTYAEMTNVPLFLWGPGRVPAGLTISDTVQTIDLMPTLLELCGLELPAGVQGQSLVPLLGGAGSFAPRPAFAEARYSNFNREPEPHETESVTIVEGDWHLIHNFSRAEGRPEYELYHRRDDPLEQTNLAAAEPARVAELAEKLRLWRTWAESQRLDGEAAAELSDSDLAELQKLGYAR